MNREACVRLLMSNAAENIKAAQELLENRHFGVSASRAYYAMFYAAQAALLHLDLQFRKHSAVISAFNKEFVKSGIFPASLSKSLRNSFELRLDSDYGLVPVSREEALAIVQEADDFISIVREHFLKQGYVLDEK